MALPLTFRSPASARLALRLLRGYDPRARKPARATVTACVSFAVAVSPAAFEGPTFSGITGTQGPTR